MSAPPWAATPWLLHQSVDCSPLRFAPQRGNNGHRVRRNWNTRGLGYGIDARDGPQVPSRPTPLSQYAPGDNSQQRGRHGRVRMLPAVLLDLRVVAPRNDVSARHTPSPPEAQHPQPVPSSRRTRAADRHGSSAPALQAQSDNPDGCPGLHKISSSTATPAHLAIQNVRRSRSPPQNPRRPHQSERMSRDGAMRPHE